MRRTMLTKYREIFEEKIYNLLKLMKVESQIVNGDYKLAKSFFFPPTMRRNRKLVLHVNV